ncbi:MAG: tetratricopeptide repeat protein [Woeseiaceae bacterium]
MKSAVTVSFAGSLHEGEPIFRFFAKKAEPSGATLRVENNVRLDRKCRQDEGEDREMSAEFWVLVVAMAALAIGFVAAPMFQQGQSFRSTGIAAALPLFAIGLYLTVGSPEAADIESPTHAAMQPTTSKSSSKTKSTGSVASMVEGLAERLKQNPDDSKGWLLLARSYQHLRRLPEAKAAYVRAVELGEFDEALASMATSTRDDFSSGEPAVLAAQVSGRVDLSRESAEIAQPTDTIFVFARAIGGPPMPVAVLRKSVSELPFDFRLDDSHAMSGAARLSDYERVIVTARVTRAGDAKNALRGLEATSGALVVADHDPVTLIIDSQE